MANISKEERQSRLDRVTEAAERQKQVRTEIPHLTNAVYAMNRLIRNCGKEELLPIRDGLAQWLRQEGGES